MADDDKDRKRLSMRHNTGTQLFLHLAEALRPLIHNTNDEVLDWDHLVDETADGAADFRQLDELIPQVIRDLADACHDAYLDPNEYENVRRVFCRHLLVQLRLRTAAVADFVARLTHPDEDVHMFVGKQSSQIDYLVDLFYQAHSLRMFEGFELPPVEIRVIASRLTAES